MVYRKIHGTIIEIFVEEFFDTRKGSLSKKYTSQQIDPDTLKANSQKLEYEDEFINIGREDYWILNSRKIKYQRPNKAEEVQKFIFEDISNIADSKENFAEKINEIIERSVIKAPEHYLWHHRRFKSQAPEIYD